MTIAERMGHGKEARRTAELEKDAYIDAGKLVLSARSAMPSVTLAVAVLALASLASFGLGMLAGKEEGGPKPDDSFWIEKLGAATAAAASSTASSTAVVKQKTAIASPARVTARSAPISKPVSSAKDGSVIASKTGTTYYLPWCGAAKRIKEANRVTFESRAAAESAGYKPAKNCKGL